MSTRSIIATVTPEGKCKAIYCHFDGYPEGVGQTLLDHYKDQNKIDALMALGDISCLAEEITCPEGHSFEHRSKGYTTAYHRDRGEDFHITELESIDLLKKIDSGQDYTYLWDGRQWLMASGKNTPIKPLANLIKPHLPDISKLRKEIASLTIDLNDKGYQSTFFFCHLGSQAVVTEKDNFSNTLATLEFDDNSLEDLNEYKKQLEVILQKAS